MNEANKSLAFLPPIKHNRLEMTSKHPVYMESNIGRDKQLYEFSLDRFNILTNQPKNIENCKLSSYTTNSSNAMLQQRSTGSTFPRATPVFFKWDEKEMPKIRVVKTKHRPMSLIENANEKRMRLEFEQMNMLKNKMNRSTNISHDVDTFITRSTSNFLPTGLEGLAQRNPKDLWASNEFNDVNLSKQIIDQFYSLDHRQMRYFRKLGRPNFYKLTASRKQLDLLKPLESEE
jgi:hypothetical protein